MIPEDTREQIINYVVEGIPPGSFLRAVLAGDLYEAFGLADERNRHAMFDICQFIHECLPLACYRSYQTVDEYLQTRRSLREGKDGMTFPNTAEDVKTLVEIFRQRCKTHRERASV